jgi:hypothetical protein
MFGAKIWRRRGLSLVEVLIASTLLLGLLALMTQVVGPVMRASNRTAVRVELQSLATVAMQKLTTDLTHTSSTGISGPFVGADNTVKFALHPKTGFSTDGTPLFSTQLVVYRWRPSTQKLSRVEWPASPTNTMVSPLKVRQLDELQIDEALVAGAERVLAPNVSNFYFQSGGGVGIRLPLEVGLRLEKESAPDILEAVELNRTVLVRN